MVLEISVFFPPASQNFSNHSTGMWLGTEWYNPQSQGPALSQVTPSQEPPVSLRQKTDAS